jgi:hypothetical protein
VLHALLLGKIPLFPLYNPLHKENDARLFTSPSPSAEYTPGHNINFPCRRATSQKFERDKNRASEPGCVFRQNQHLLVGVYSTQLLVCQLGKLID